MAYYCWLYDLVLFYEGADVLCHGRVVMAWRMRRVAMVAEILCNVLVSLRSRAIPRHLNDL